MARYNREFLVPYLENLCALHIIKQKIERKNNDVARQGNELSQEFNHLTEPSPPMLEGIGFQVFGLVSGICSLLISLCGILSVLTGLLGLSLVIGYGIWLYKIKSENELLENSYNCAIITYERKLKELQKKEDEYNDYAFFHFSVNESRLEQVDAALQKMYSANIIPRRYRDIYVAVYLYDWFSTSMADDLDMALNMYVLEEIKDRLDRIIDQLAKILLNQRTIIENQQKSMEQQEQYRKEMFDKLDRLQLAAEDQRCYLEMIEANTAASAFFSAAQYIKEL